MSDKYWCESCERLMEVDDWRVSLIRQNKPHYQYIGINIPMCQFGHDLVEYDPCHCGKQRVEGLEDCVACLTAKANAQMPLMRELLEKTSRDTEQPVTPLIRRNG